jgi:hypothetical protein
MLKQQDPRTGIRGRRESGKSFKATQQYSGLSPCVKVESCWWCDYFRARVDARRRQHIFCGLTGEQIRPESLCHVYVASEVAA